ncbi:hypothetical protein CTI14_45005, partial [Methylobacterium radiotolerans]
TPKVLAVAERDGVFSEVLDIPVRWDKAWAVDSKKPAQWVRRVENSTTKDSFAYRPPYQVGAERRLGTAGGPEATIRYTTDGSNPRSQGAAYEAPTWSSRSTPKVLAVAERDGVFSEVLDIPVRWDKAWAVDS